METLGKLLYERRQRGNFSQRAAARQLKVAPQTYIWWERNATTPRLAKAGSIAGWLGIPESDVLAILRASEIRLARRHSRQQQKGVGLRAPGAPAVKGIVV